MPHQENNQEQGKDQEDRKSTVMMPFLCDCTTTHVMAARTSNTLEGSGTLYVQEVIPAPGEPVVSGLEPSVAHPPHIALVPVVLCSPEKCEDGGCCYISAFRGRTGQPPEADGPGPPPPQSLN